MAKNQIYSTEVTVSSGSGSEETDDFLPMEDAGGRIVQVIVEPPTENHGYTFSILNSRSKTIYKKKNVIGTLNDDREITTIKGTHTLSFSDSSDDGIYTVEVTYAPNW